MSPTSEATQPQEWAKLEALHGDKTGEQILTDLCKWTAVNGSLATRHRDTAPARGDVAGGRACGITAGLIAVRIGRPMV